MFPVFFPANDFLSEPGGDTPLTLFTIDRPNLRINEHEAIWVDAQPNRISVGLARHQQIYEIDEINRPRLLLMYDSRGRRDGEATAIRRIAAVTNFIGTILRAATSLTLLSE